LASTLRHPPSCTPSAYTPLFRSPPGFDRVMRERLNKWARRNAALFHTADGGVDEALVVVLTGAMAGAVSEISLLDDEEAARNLAAEIMSIVGTIRNPRTEQR